MTWFRHQGIDTSDANATASNILSGKTAYVNGAKITGTMTNRSGTTVTASTVSKDSNYVYLNIPSSGYYTTNSRVRTNLNNVGAIDLNSAQKIFYEQTINTNFRRNYSSAALVYNNEIYQFGCDNIRNNYSTIYKYNDTNGWSTTGIPYLSNQRPKAVVYDNKIHVTSYRNHWENSAWHYVYDGSSWSSISPVILRPGVNSRTAKYINYKNEIHILGCPYNGNMNQYKNLHYKWDGTSMTYNVSVLPTSFEHFSAVVYNNEIHMVGGFANRHCSHYKWNGVTWTSISVPEGSQSRQLVVHNNKMYLIGGFILNNDYINLINSKITYNSYNGVNNIYIFNNNKWDFISSLGGFFTGSAISYNNSIHLIGAYTQQIYNVLSTYVDVVVYQPHKKLVEGYFLPSK